MNVQTELHELVDRLDDVSDAKQRLHALVDELGDETARQILERVETLRLRRLDKWGFSR